VYFDLKTAGARGKEDVQIGQGFLNLKQLLTQGRDFTSTPVKLQGRKGPAGTLNVSLAALDALRALDAPAGGSAASRFSRGGASQQPAPAAAPDPLLEVEVGAFTIAPALRNNREVSEVYVEIDLVDLVDAAQLTTQRLNKLTPRLDFRFRHSLPIAPGSAEQGTLRRVLAAANEEESDVYFQIKSITPRGEPVDVGQAYVNLRKVLDEGREITKAMLPVKGINNESLGTLTVSILALRALQDALAGAQPPAAAAPAPASRSNATRFVDSFGAHAPAPSAARAFVAGAPAGARAVAAAPAGARAVAAPGGQRAGAARATAAAAPAASPARATATAASPARATATATSGRATAVAAPAQARAQPAQARGQPARDDPADFGGADSVLTIRLESISLGGSLQTDHNIRHFFLSAKVLGKVHKTAELRKTSPPMRVNQTIEMAVGEGSREQQDLLRVMQSGPRQAADVLLALEWFDASASGGGDEPEQLAFGAINLRDLWEGRRDLASQQVQLITDDGEVTKLMVSTSILPTLERVMQPRR
jgi:hypothetical protein